MILAFDSDMVIKKQVHDAVLAHAEFLKYRGAKVRFCHLPHPDGGGKLGLDDYLALGHTKDDLERSSSLTRRNCSMKIDAKLMRVTIGRPNPSVPKLSRSRSAQRT